MRVDDEQLLEGGTKKNWRDKALKGTPFQHR